MRLAGDKEMCISIENAKSQNFNEKITINNISKDPNCAKLSPRDVRRVYDSLPHLLISQGVEDA